MISLERILPRASVQYGGRNALYSDGRWLTYAQLAERVYRFAGALTGLGLKPGDRIAVLDSNSPEYLEAYYAAVHIGAVLVSVNSRLSIPELECILKDCTPRILVVGAAFLTQLEQLRQRKVDVGQVIVCAGKAAEAAEYDDLLNAATALRQPRASRPDELTSIYYTSGTTGEPKGVCLTGANMSASALDVIVGLGLGRSDVWLHAAPLFHLVDAWAVWALPILGAAQATVHFTPDAFISMCDVAQVTHAALPPTLISLLCGRLKAKPSELRSLKQVMYGGSPMPPAVLTEAQHLFAARLCNSYGATETSGTLTIDQSDEPGLANGAGVSVASAIIDVLDRDGRSVPIGKMGEIVVGGPRIMAGYWNKPMATKEVIVNGRYRTGDIGYFDAAGNLFIADRKKDMIITGGENVYSIEVESVLALHPAVRECAVVGIPHEKWVEAVHAVVVLMPGAHFDEAELLAFCRGKIAPYKIPKTVEILQKRLPRSGTGKIVKHEIRSWYSGNSTRGN